MSRQDGKVITLEREPERRCDFCGVLAECRPYGPGGRDICLECAERDYYDVCVHNMGILLYGKTGELK